MKFDGVKLRETCRYCEECDNHDKKHPITILDIESGLCEYCFNDQDDA